MTRTFVKSVVAASVAAGLVLSMTGVALPAGKPPAHKPKPPKTPIQDPRQRVKPVLLFNQTFRLAQGLTPKAALKMASHYLHYNVTTAHYMPKGFQLVEVQFFPYVPNAQEPQDTLYFEKLSVAMKPHNPRHFEVPVFEVDHQYAQPYVYPSGVAYFTVKSAKAGKRSVTVAEQKYKNVHTGKTVHLIYVYWFDKKTKLATEVTSDLATSTLTRADMLKIAGSVS